jgi:hypothetical protein
MECRDRSAGDWGCGRDQFKLVGRPIRDAAIAAHLQAATVHATEAVKNGDDKTWPNAVVVSAVLDKYP